jgi:mitogen-activated protein kinase kinase
LTRPMGPRSFTPRSSSPLPHPPETNQHATHHTPALRSPRPPLTIRKPLLPSVQIPTGNPSYYHGPPTQPDGADATIREVTQHQRPNLLSVQIPVGNPGYYNGPQVQPETPDIATLRPDVAQPTVVPQGPIGDIKTLLHEITTRHDDRIVDDREDPHQSQGSIVSNMKYTDDDFEQIGQLGEGAGGVVHKVKEKRTEKVMARKTITTRETPMKQLLRELNIISSNKHSNIIHFFGAYMSPSTSEIKILMEYCEGGSLEAVGKQIKERGAVVGEMIVARLAEGVSAGRRPSCLTNCRLHSFLRSFKDLPTFTQRRPFTEISSHRIFCCPRMGLLNSAILVFQAS